MATRGGQAVGDVVGTMDAISDSSRRIADIVGVIDGIAFQTNILALNAAVEAARAGEQGKGFAVVASEVRALAQRSAAAAKEIKGLIDDSVQKVSIGSDQVEAAGATMQEIVTSVRRVTDIINEISSGLRRAVAGHRAGEPGGVADGRSDAAERGAGGRSRRRGRLAAGAGAAPGRGGGGVQGQHRRSDRNFGPMPALGT
ncbi:methyl-accepting chemotaxis protein, partial [Piscirickettsia salmonis]|uniref:methyl-accepting chemotaxis protein n=1 Tax=Piscirickettsia salmonis TaxID=1238 RepID=UPI0027B8E2D3